MDGAEPLSPRLAARSCPSHGVRASARTSCTTCRLPRAAYHGPVKKASPIVSLSLLTFPDRRAYLVVGREFSGGLGRVPGPAEPGWRRRVQVLTDADPRVPGPEPSVGCRQDRTRDSHDRSEPWLQLGGVNPAYPGCPETLHPRQAYLAGR